MVYALPADADYFRIKELLIRRISSDRQKGGDHAVLSDLHDRWAVEHDTTTRERGEPCDECGQAWPCGVVRGIITAMD